MVLYKPVETAKQRAARLQQEQFYAKINTNAAKINANARSDQTSPSQPTQEKVFSPRDRIRQIQRVVAEHYGKKPEALLSDDKTHDVTRPRQVSMYLCRVITGRSFPRIGWHHQKDHTTTLYSVRKIAGLIGDTSITQASGVVYEVDPTLVATVAKLRKQLES